MPLYEFVCQACGASFEDICAAGAAAPACPECGENAAERKISAPGPLHRNPFPFPPTGAVHPLASRSGPCSCPGAKG